MNAFLDFIGRHPHAALLIVMLVGFAESLAIVGTLIPAAIVMFGAGALIGNGRSISGRPCSPPPWEPCSATA